MTEYRTEHDSMGEVSVPAQALWGAHTQRAVGNFGAISDRPVPFPVIRELARIKAAAAQVNAELRVIEPDMGAAIAAAAREVADGGHEDQFPVPVFQTGSGTSSNMNVNEVIARLAAQRLGCPVHANDHVNASQSSNDVFPTAVHLAVAGRMGESLRTALRMLAEALEAKAAEFGGVVKSGRTHLMDATPVTLGQEFGGYAAAIRHGIARIDAALPDICELPLGGTAVGTGLNAPAGFAGRVIDLLRGDYGTLPLTEARNHFEAAGARDGLVAASGVLRTVAVSIYKICNDLRLMGSGPRAGLAEINIPDLQPGSSIMPGKVNPVLPEVLCQIAAQVIGNDAAVGFAGAAGNFELNVMMPVMARNLLESSDLLTAGSTRLAQACIAGITANAGRLRRYAESSPAIVTALNPFIGYEAAAKVAHEALETGATIRAVVISQGHVASGKLTLEQLDRALDVLAMTRPAPPAG